MVDAKLLLLLLRLVLEQVVVLPARVALVRAVLVEKQTEDGKEGDCGSSEVEGVSCEEQ